MARPTAPRRCLPPKPVPAPPQGTIPPSTRESIGRIIDGMIDEMDDGTGWVRTSRVGDQLIKRYPDFDVRNFGSKSLNKFLASLPELEVEERILANGNPIQFVHMRPAPAPKKAARKTTTKRRTTRKSK